MKRDYCVSCYIFHEHRVLLLHHKKLGRWLPAGGHIEADETPIEALHREVLEETGLKVEIMSDDQLWIEEFNACSLPRPQAILLEEIPAWGNTAAHQHIDLVYAGRPKGDPILAPLEDQELRWFTEDEVSSLDTKMEIFAETQTMILHLFSKSQASLALEV